MLIGICGGICAGKATVQQYLIERHGFTPLKIPRTHNTPSVEKSASDLHVPSPVPTPQPLTFPDVNSLLDYATANWRTAFVTTSIYTKDVVDILSRRPFFILLQIDAPISLRWQRFQARCLKSDQEPPTLEEFVLRNDEHMYSPTTGLASLASQAQIKLLNTASSLQQLHTALDELNLRAVGCVLVRHSRVIATGYNGTPRNTLNCLSGGCPRCNNSGLNPGGASLSTCLCIHAEENALLEAGRERVGQDAVLYCTTCPCLTCSIKIVQVGITEVVYGEKYYMDAQAAKIFAEAGIKLRQFEPPESGLVDLGDPGRASFNLEHELSAKPLRMASTNATNGHST
ncbi:hypothetical protein AMS68_004281 [Peltaster fructicola]|uniref:Deoxycytidylate deaminase n=1 Tax=Peltaster fructicola TaxID=286661 RepID=A0A6H0XVL0_9PEZI|nr:hypothetical protein AMS68_004281 [Peltaster fructicola]